MKYPLEKSYLLQSSLVIKRLFPKFCIHTRRPSKHAHRPSESDTFFPRTWSLESITSINGPLGKVTFSVLWSRSLVPGTKTAEKSFGMRRSRDVFAGLTLEGKYFFVKNTKGEFLRHLHLNSQNVRQSYSVSNYLICGGGKMELLEFKIFIVYLALI